MVLKCLGLCRSKHIKSEFPSSGPTVIEELCHHFSLADLGKSTNNFDKNQIIGYWAFGAVYKGCLQHNVATDCTVAVKRMKVKRVWRLKDFKNEIELICQLRHPNLVSLIGFCNHKDENIIVYEYMHNGSLLDHLHNNREMEPLSWKKRLEICIGAARGVHYLHTGAKRTIIHRGIKPSNILLDSNMVPKISGFEFSLQGQLFTSKPKPIKTNVEGTIGFLAPEYAIMGRLTDRSDVYSFGAVLIEVICAKSYTEISREMDEELAREELETPIRSDMSELPNEEPETPIPSVLYGPIPSVLYQRLRAGEIIDPVLAGKIAPECLELYIDIIDRCVKYEPNERPAMGEVEVELEHALTLQQEADARNTGGDYSLLSPSITHSQQEDAPISA